MMKAERLGILSAVFASVCCLGPVLLVLLGLGSLGVGAVLGRYHWWFIGAAMALLTYAWRSYLKEVRRCKTASCEMARGTTTRTMLLLASVIVAIFVGLNLYTYASQPHKAPSTGTAPRTGQLASVVIPVEGMTCAMCELAIEQRLAKHPGVLQVDAQAATQQVVVTYDTRKVDLHELRAVIDKAGYQTQAPAEGNSP